MNPFDIKKKASEVILSNTLRTTSKVLDFAKSFLLKQIIPHYVQFGRFFLIKDMSHIENNVYYENFKFEDSNFKEYSELCQIKIDKILNHDQLVLFYQSHSIKNYYQKLKPFFKGASGANSLKVPSFDGVFVSNNFAKSSIDTNQNSLSDNNFYNIQVFVNASFIDLCVTIWGKNIEYITDSKLYNDYESELKSVEAESNMGSFKRFNFIIDSFVSQDKLKKDNTFKLKLISHFNNVLFKITISPDDVDTNGLTY
jgi:hypothetical protein